MLYRVQVVELLRRLHEGNLLVYKVPKRMIEEIRKRDLIGIEDRDKLAIGLGECSIDISCFMMCVSRSCKIVHTHRFTELTQRRTTPIVQYPCLMRIMHVQCSKYRHAQNREVLIIGGNKDIDCASSGRCGVRYGLQIPRHEHEQRKVDRAIKLYQ